MKQGIVPTNWGEWAGKRIAKAIGIAVVILLWELGGATFLALVFAIQTSVGFSLVFFKRRGEL